MTPLRAAPRATDESSEEAGAILRRRRLYESMTITLQPVVFRRRLAAAASKDRFFLAPHLDALEQDHPDRVFVSLMCWYAREVMVGGVPGPYSDSAAELTVRDALIDDEDFVACSAWDDAMLAERYAVPLDQIPHKRSDLQRGERLQRRGGWCV